MISRWGVFKTGVGGGGCVEEGRGGGGVSKPNDEGHFGF